MPHTIRLHRVIKASPDKVYQDGSTGDFVITDVDGLKLGVRWRFDGEGYDVASSEFRTLSLSVSVIRHESLELVLVMVFHSRYLRVGMFQPDNSGVGC